MKIQQLHEVEGRRTLVLVCERGDDPVEALTAAAKRLDYARRVIREQVEVVSLVGNVALDAGEPRVHVALIDIDWSGSW